MLHHLLSGTVLGSSLQEGREQSASHYNPSRILGEGWILAVLHKCLRHNQALQIGPGNGQGHSLSNVSADDFLGVLLEPEGRGAQDIKKGAKSSRPDPKVRYPQICVKREGGMGNFAICLAAVHLSSKESERGNRLSAAAIIAAHSSYCAAQSNQHTLPFYFQIKVADIYQHIYRYPYMLELLCHQSCTLKHAVCCCAINAEHLHDCALPSKCCTPYKRQPLVLEKSLFLCF